MPTSFKLFTYMSGEPISGAGGERRRRGSTLVQTHVGSLVGSMGGAVGRPGFADFMGPDTKAVKRYLDIDGENIQDGDGNVLDIGVGAPSETERLLNERQELLQDNHVPIQSYGSSQEPPAAAIEDAWDDAVAEGNIKTGFSREIKVLAANAAPLAVTFFLQYSLVVTSVFSVGHIGKIELGAVSLASMTANITGFAVIQGMATCLDTLCSQAYGAKRPDLVGLYAQKCFVMSLACFIPVWVLWFYIDVVLGWILPAGEERLIHLAHDYLRIVSFGIPGWSLFECGKRFLQAQGIFHASTYVLMICAPLNVLLNYTFVWSKHFGIGFQGAPLAVCVTDWVMAILLICYAVFVDGRKCWSGFSSSAFSGWGTLIKLALPGVIMVESEFMAFEILTLSSSHLGTTALASQTVLSSVSSLVYQIPFSFSVAVSTRVANYIGAGLKDAAITTVKVANVTAVIVSIIDGLFMFVFRYPIAGVFTSDPDVIEMVAKTIRVVVLMHVFDGSAITSAGILRGQGRQRIGGMLNLGFYYVVGVPFALLFAFKLHMGVEGLWAGIALAIVCICTTASSIIAKSDWDGLIEKSRETIC